MAQIHILNGPNLNLLGTRQPEVYGSTTLADVEAACRSLATELGHHIEWMQSNYEGGLVEAVHAARGVADALIINAGAYTHTSVALMDAALSVELPVVEVHLSNTSAREEFRHHSYLSKAALGVIAGFGLASYTTALHALDAHLAS